MNISRIVIGFIIVVALFISTQFLLNAQFGSVSSDFATEMKFREELNVLKHEIMDLREQMKEQTTTNTHSLVEDPQSKADETERLKRRIESLEKSVVEGTSSKAISSSTKSNNFIRRAIVVFYHYKTTRGKDFGQEITWLHYNWQKITNKYRQIDLFIFSDPQSIQTIPEDWKCVSPDNRDPDVTVSNCVLIEHAPPNSKTFKEYKNLNSLEFLAHDDSLALEEYDLVLKTDIDIFLTPAFAAWYPNGFLVGQGGYGFHEYTQARLRRISKKLGLVHRGYHNLGQAWYGPGKRIREVAALAVQNAIHCWENEINEPTEWPKWWRTCVMYGSEMALNHLVPDIIFDKLIDVNSVSDESIFKAKVIHCFHNKAPFNKFVFNIGCYDNLNTTGVDHTIVRNWVLELALRATGKKDDSDTFAVYPAVEHPQKKEVLWPQIDYDHLFDPSFKCPTERKHYVPYQRLNPNFKSDLFM